MKIAVLGYSGSGKSTLTKHLATQYAIPLLYLDRVQFVADWQERDRAEARGLVADFMQQSDWVIDGNYTGFLQQERLAQADRIVLLLFGRWACLWRALVRKWRYRHAARESMADGCIEKIDLEFVWWILYKGRNRQKREQFAAIVRQYPHKTAVLRNQRELDAFIRATTVQATESRGQA